MKLKLSEPGYAVSGGVHLLVLLLLVLTVASKPDTFDPMQETVPIETVSDSEFNRVMQGDKSAKEIVKDATTKVDKVDPTPDPTPKPVTAQADKTVPTPPPPPVQQPPQPPTPATPPPPPVAAAEPTPPTPPPVPTPPSRPTPAPSPPVPTPPERVDADAEPIAPKPVPTPPQPQRVAEAKPIPPPKPRPVPKPPRVMPKPDQLAKLLDQAADTPTPAEKPSPKAAKAARQPAPPAPVAPPPAPEQTDDQSHTFDLTDISRLLLSHDAPAQKAATGKAPSKVASLGSPTAHDNKMAPSLWGQLDGLMEEQYRQCWSYLGLNAGQKYVPQIRVTYDESGGLASEPVLVNPPNDPSLRNLAESALRAVRRCNPLRIPAQYAPYYDEWKGRVLRFDPQEMAG